MLRCRVLGHRLRFRADGATMRWECERGCGHAGEKAYDSPERARRYARALDREDRDALGRRAPFFGLLPLRLWRMARDRAERPPTGR